MLDQMTDWVNSNQGTVSIAIFALTVFFGLVGWLAKNILKKHFNKKKYPIIHAGGDVKSKGPIIVGDNNTILYDSENSMLEKQVKDMESKLKEVLDLMNDKDGGNKNTSQRTITNSDDYKKVLTIISEGPSTENKTKLRKIFYSTTFKLTQLQVILTLSEWYNPMEDNIDDLIDLCDEGIRIAEKINAKEEKAVLLAYKGDFVTIQFSNLDTETALKIVASNSTGMPLITEEERKKVIEKLNSLYALSDSCFISAEKLAKNIKSFKALGFVYTQIGVSAGHRFIHLNHFGVDSAKHEKQLSRRAFMLAKEIYAMAGNDLQIAYVYYNFANQLRGFGEYKEATELLNDVRSIALRYNEQNLVKAANVLSDRIKSGDIPNYVQS